MESVGDEKRIQALFSELSLEDKTYAPHFEKLWRAETTTCVPTLVIMRAVSVTVAIVVLAAVCLLAASSWYRSSQSQHAANIPPQAVPTAPVPVIRKPEKLASAVSKSFRNELRRRAVRQRQTERISTPEVATLSNWQSPTSIFLQSPTASLLSSLPQLDQSARDLETFLPKNNEVMKEFKQ